MRFTLHDLQQTAPHRRPGYVEAIQLIAALKDGFYHLTDEQAREISLQYRRPIELTLWEKTVSLADHIGQNVSAMMRERRTSAPSEIKAVRDAICATCDHFNQRTRFCRLCSCFMPAKTRLLYAICPAGKWPQGASS